jgi:Amt family ammonium transporter
MAERWKFSSFVVWGLFCGAIYYPLYGAWVWGGGWLSQLGNNLGLGHGAVDFAGSGVVHAMGGMAALAGAMVLGPRIGKYGADGKPRAIPGHHIPMAMLGTFILLFGWFGFNSASTFAASDLRFAVAALNTMLAAGFGATTTMFLMWRKFGKPDPSMSANGMLAGLVGITAPCAFVAPWAAAVIGIVAGVIVVYAVLFIEHKMRVDDPVGAVAVHGVNGIWGVVALGLFADGTYGEGWNGVAGGVTGLFYGDAGQLVAQLISVVTVVVFGFGVSYAFFKIQNAVQGIRSKEADEIAGLDLPEMGTLAYPDFLEAQGPVFLPTDDLVVSGADAARLREEAVR